MKNHTLLAIIRFISNIFKVFFRPMVENDSICFAGPGQKTFNI